MRIKKQHFHGRRRRHQFSDISLHGLYDVHGSILPVLSVILGLLGKFCSGNEWQVQAAARLWPPELIPKRDL